MAAPHLGKNSGIHVSAETRQQTLADGLAQVRPAAALTAPQHLDGLRCAASWPEVAALDLVEVRQLAPERESSESGDSRS